MYKNYTADYKFFQEHQQKSRRFPVFPGGISNSRRFPVFPVFPGVVDTMNTAVIYECPKFILMAYFSTIQANKCQVLTK